MVKRLLPTAVILIFVLLQTVRAEVSYTGSSTIGENIIPEAAKAFTKKTGIKFGTIENPGSGKGLEAVMKGRAKLAGASRPLRANEKRRKLYYQIIGYDAIGIYVHRNNPVASLTGEQVKGIFTGKIKNWMEVGGNDAPIVVITETWGEKRATMIEFQKLAMDGAEYRADRIEVNKPRDQAAKLAGEENGIISVSIAFARPEIKAIIFDNVAPEPENVRSGAYLLSRPLLLVTKGLPKGDLEKFFDFIISPEGQRIVSKKFVAVK